MSFRSEESITLSDESLDNVSKANEEFLSGGRVEHEDISKLNRNMKNALFAWQQRFGQGKEITISRSRFFGKSAITYKCGGECCNPLVGTDSGFRGDDWSASFSDSLDEPPKFDYNKGENRVTFVGVRQKPKVFFILLISLLLGCLIGLAGLMLIPESVRLDICNIVLEPLYSTYLNGCAFFGMPLIYLSVTMGIVGVGNLKTFSTLGTGLIKSYLKFIVALAVVSVLFGLIVFNPQITNSGLNLEYSAIVNLVLRAIPSGIFQPFLDKHAFQLVLIGVVSGIAILYLDITDGGFCRFMADFRKMLIQSAQWFSVVIPFFILISYINAIWRSSFFALFSVLKFLVAIASIQVLIVFSLIAYISEKYKVRMGLVFKKVLKVFLIAAGTDSCSASISENNVCCGSQLGIDEKVYSFGISMGTAIFKPATVARLVLICFLSVKAYGMSISISWLAALVILSVVISISIPAIRGGVIMFLGTLFTNLGIPTEAIAGMLTVEIFFDCFCTGINQIAVSLMLTIFAGKVNLLDLDTLRRAN